MIFDTNVLIYLSKNTVSVDKLQFEQASVSIISKIEALGFDFKNPTEHKLLNQLFTVITVIPLTDLIAEETIRLRAKFRIKLPDAVIYSTASVTGLPLLTHNIDDFKRLDNRVKLIDPFTL